MQRKLIGLGYKARQGKSTVAEAMRDCYPTAIKIFALADELKRYCAAHHFELLNAFPTERTKTTPKPDPIYGHTDILQWFGTDVMRKKDPDFWIKKLEDRIAGTVEPYIIIPDVRFPNEAEFIRSNGGTLVKITRLNADGSDYVDPGRDPKHESETALDGYTGWDCGITVQTGRLDTLRKSAQLLFEAITGERPNANCA